MGVVPQEQYTIRAEPSLQRFRAGRLFLDCYRLKKVVTVRRRGGEITITQMNERLTPPENCANLDEIRQGMDSVYRQMIALMAERVAYVRAAAKFKNTATSVAAPQRVQAVL